MENNTTTKTSKLSKKAIVAITLQTLALVAVIIWLGSQYLASWHYKTFIEPTIPVGTTYRHLTK